MIYEIIYFVTNGSISVEGWLIRSNGKADKSRYTVNKVGIIFVSTVTNLTIFFFLRIK